MNLISHKIRSIKTGWETQEAMKKFRNNGHHLNAMKSLKNIGKAKSITWETESEPSWDEAIKKLNNVSYNPRENSL